MAEKSKVQQENSFVKQNNKRNFVRAVPVIFVLSHFALDHSLKEIDVKTIRGHFDGNVVILDEPAPVNHAAEVRVEFPEIPDAEPIQPTRLFHWQQRLPDDTFEGSVSDEVIRQRRME